jgi:Transposase DDE domain group 1
VRDKNEPFQLSFNASLKVDFQGSRVTSDGGLILGRELDERLGLGDLISEHRSDPRRGKNTQLPLADLFRQSFYSRAAGYEDVNDAERLSQDPAFRLIGSEKVWDRGTALTSRLQTFEAERLTEEENFTGLARINRELIGKVEALDSAQRVAKVEFHFGELFPRVGFIVTNLETDSRAAVRFYNKRGTAEQWIKEASRR